jgi:hypothetical protein
MSTLSTGRRSLGLSRNALMLGSPLAFEEPSVAPPEPSVEAEVGVFPGIVVSGAAVVVEDGTDEEPAVVVVCFEDEPHDASAVSGRAARPRYRARRAMVRGTLMACTASI